MKKYSYQVPERKIGEIFSYNGSMYRVEDASKQNLADLTIGCVRRDPATGNIVDLCAFVSVCGAVSMKHRGRCTSIERSDKKVVYFAKL